MEILWTIVGVVVSVLVGIGVAMALSNASSSEFLFAKACFYLSAVILGSSTLWWELKTESPFFWRLVIGCAVGGLIFVLLPVSIHWVNERSIPDLDTAELANTTKCQEAIIINKYKNRTIFSKDLESTDCQNYLGDFHDLVQRGIIQKISRFTSRTLDRSEVPPGYQPGDQFEQFGNCVLTQKGKHLAEDLLYLREHPKSKVSRPMEPLPNFVKLPSPTPDKGASPP